MLSQAYLEDFIKMSQLSLALFYDGLFILKMEIVYQIQFDIVFS